MSSFKLVAVLLTFVVLMAVSTAWSSADENLAEEDGFYLDSYTAHQYKAMGRGRRMNDDDAAEPSMEPGMSLSLIHI